MKMMQEPLPLFSLAINDAVKTLLYRVAYWGRLFSAAGLAFVLIVVARSVYTVIVITHLSMRHIGNALPALFASALVSLVPGFAFLYAYRFSVRLRKALATNDQLTLQRSLSTLMAFFRYCAVVLLLAVLFVAATWVWEWLHMRGR